jgi:hypothetical protein
VPNLNGVEVGTVSVGRRTQTGQMREMCMWGVFSEAALDDDVVWACQHVLVCLRRACTACIE